MSTVIEKIFNDFFKSQYKGVYIQKKKLKKYASSRSALQEILKEFLQAKGKLSWTAENKYKNE